MKKLFCLSITATLIIASNISSTLMVAVNYHLNQPEEPVTKLFKLNSFTNLIKALNFYRTTNMKEEEELENNQILIDRSKKRIKEWYEAFFNNKEGSVKVLNTNLKNNTNIKMFNGTYENGSDRKQNFLTQEYSDTIINSNSISISISEKISFKTSFNIPFFNNILTAEIGSEQKWNKKIETSETLTNPSQSITVSPLSVGTVTYIISQSTYQNQGVIRFPISKEYMFYFPAVIKNHDGSVQNIEYYGKLETIIGDLVTNAFDDWYYKNQLEPDYSEYTVISIDKYDQYYFNLPISWESQGGTLYIEYHEENL